METTAKIYSLSYRDVKTYFFALIFVAGNILLPQLCHFVPNGGNMWLPIYFFTLIAAYKYGLRVGLLTAILSPVVNCVFFGMPTLAVLPVLLIKSSLLAVASSYAAHKTQRISFLAIGAAILFYQVIGTAIEWAIVNDFYVAVKDFRMGVPGMLVQLIGGYFVLRAISKL
jgi:hypothetical protein